jgi:hypothetical protein
MTTSDPPKLAVALLNRVIPDNDPLAGDLIEEFHRGRSGLWFWRQVLGAALVAGFTRPREIRPLRLVDQPSMSRVLRSLPGRRTINLTASPLHGIGGLGLLAFAVLVAIVVPELWSLMLLAIAGGVVLGALFVARSRRAVRAGTPKALSIRAPRA